MIQKKKKNNGNLFIKIFENKSKKFKNLKYLAQGTLYPDIIESRSATSNNSSKIKSRHNVGGLPKMNLNSLNHKFLKDDRIIGKSLKLVDNLINKHPFRGRFGYKNYWRSYSYQS